MSTSKSIVAELNKDLKLNGENHDIWSVKIRYVLMRLHLMYPSTIKSFDEMIRHFELKEDRLASLRMGVEATLATSSSNCKTKKKLKKDKIVQR